MFNRLSKPTRRSEEEEPKALTDRLAYHTDALVEQSINSDLSFSKEESTSISNLKQDWDSIKQLQDEIRKTTDKLKQLGGVGTQGARPNSDCGKITKNERKSKMDNLQNRELKKFQEKISELSNALQQNEKEKYLRYRQGLLDMNNQLREEIVNLQDENNELKHKLNSMHASLKKSSDVYKYGQFVTKKVREIPKWEEMFSDRVSSVSSYLNAIKSGRYEECFLSTLQFLSDLLVYNLKPENVASKFVAESQKKTLAADDSENLLTTINAQNERIAKLNKQISEAMISSKELLYSPLAPVLKKDVRNSKSTCYTPSSGKVLYVTPERWRVKRDVIPENNPEEEFSGKPLGH